VSGGYHGGMDDDWATSGTYLGRDITGREASQLRKASRMKQPGKLDLATLLRIKRWFREAPGPEAESFHWVLNKIDKAIKKEQEHE
jgi:hypothetical protein